MKILIIVSLAITLNACSMMDRAVKPSTNKAVAIEDKGRGAVDAVVGEQASFKWEESSDSFSKLAVMPEADRNKVVAALKTSGVNGSLYFDYDGVEISEKASQKVEKHAQFMQDNPTIRLRLEGHTDARGTREYNLALGENRALSVKQVMELYKGIGNRIEVVSYGEEKPKSTVDNESGWQENRRVEFVYK
jgi:peptidoglycan-associated lipoprotein